MLGKQQLPEWYGKISGRFEPSKDDALLVEIRTDKAFWVELDGVRIYLTEGKWHSCKGKFMSGEYRLSMEEIALDLMNIQVSFPGRVYVVSHLVPFINEENYGEFPWLKKVVKARYGLATKLKTIADKCSCIEYIDINKVFTPQNSPSLLKEREEGAFKLDLNHYSSLGILEAYNLIKTEIRKLED